MGETMSSAAAHIAALADQCVKCGLCLPHCPTYRVGRSEAESPRGRIAFAHALARGQLAATPALTTHLDNCLACMSCERVCPSHVRYAQLIVATRGLLHETAAIRGKSTLDFLLARPRLLRVLLRLADALRPALQSRWLRPLWRVCGLARWVQELPRLPRVKPLPSAQPVPSRGRIGLFVGCVAGVVDRDVHAAAARLLGALGYEVVVPRTQGCCGALALHAGDIAQADASGHRVRAAFAGTNVDTVLVSASGCCGTLRDCVFAGAVVRVREIHEFLDADDRIGELRWRPYPARIALHTPCTQTNIARAGAAVGRLLARIPQLDVTALPEQPACCGAAGDYFLGHAAIADALRAETLEQARTAKPDLLVTSNVGCRIFLDNGLRQLGIDVPVTHPVVLLAQQLEN
jgi:glycolate oxidase iron-sulfur subunit